MPVGSSGTGYGDAVSCPVVVVESKEPCIGALSSIARLDTGAGRSARLARAGSSLIQPCLRSAASQLTEVGRRLTESR
jgi:hypothetical protein